MSKIIYIKYHDENIEKAIKIKKGDWIDLRAAEDVTLNQWDYYEIPLGVSMRLPKNYEAYLAPRGSTFKKWGIIQVNSPGVIDNSFSGDADVWKMPVVALRDTKISRNDRICQFRINIKMGSVRFIIKQFLSNTSRGSFGSTGKANITI